MPLLTLSLVVIGIGIIGWRVKAQGGWRNFSPPVMRLALLPVIGLGLQYFALQLAGGTERVILYAVSLILLIGFFVVNWKQRALGLLAIGFLLNLVPILFNGGYMPITPEAMTALHPATTQWIEGLTRAGSKDIILSAGRAPFWFLGDVLVVSHPFPMPTAFSIGDLVILAGFGWTIYQFTKNPGVHYEPN